VYIDSIPDTPFFAILFLKKKKKKKIIFNF
jgi:hypothetical protein